VTAGQLTVGGAALALAAVGFAFGSRVLAPKPAPAPRQERQYSDPVEVRAKLERIGRALVLYRQDYPAKPVGEWRNYMDAGLPLGIRRLAIPGKPWSIAREELFYEPANSLMGGGMVSNFSSLYRLGTLMPELDLDWPSLLQRNGHRQIVLFDTWYPNEPWNGEPEPHRRTMVLRWDGTVEEVEFVRRGPAGVGDLVYR